MALFILSVTNGFACLACATSQAISEDDRWETDAPYKEISSKHLILTKRRVHKIRAAFLVATKAAPSDL